MKTLYIVGGIVVAVLIIGGIILYMNHPAMMSQNPAQTTTDAGTPAPSGTSNTQATTNSPTTGASPATGVQTSVSASAAMPAPKSFTVNGNDATADLKTITVPAGTPVTITFGADQGTTYHGGLDFRSSVVNTGTITPGSTKTITFTATKSFSFTPYWPATNIAKPYTIDIVVQ